MLTVTEVSTTCAVVIFRVKVSRTTSVVGMYASSVVMLLAIKTHDVIRAIRSAYCHSLTVVQLLSLSKDLGGRSVVV